MKILYVITQLGVGGAESVLVSMANTMIGLGHDVEVVSLLNINKQNFDEKVTVHLLDLRHNPVSSLIQFRSILSKFQPDVVHSHCLHANIVTRLVRVIYPMKRLVTTAHNTYEGQGLIMSIFKYTNFLSNKITNVSTDAVQAFENNKYVKPSQMNVMFNIIDIHKFEYSSDIRDEYRNIFGVHEDDLVVIAVGSMKDSKDYPNLLKAIQLLTEDELKKIKVFIVGDGLLMAETQHLATTLNIESYISFLGIRNDVNSLLNMADIFVLSSKHEGLPTVLVEAAMAKNVIVSTNCGGVNDILPNFDNVVNIQDATALAQKLSEVMRLSKEEHLQQSEATYSYVKERLDPQKIAKEWLEIYQA
ncbi:glycosyltransferase [Acinetobacter sp. ANC 3882]|uniref:glycosyltransferase n=1 Tax=Acinetobacter sp. ANC 3882 TaxID=2923423 RepID=UPI001F4A839B|nr:glycosyltransferase [Acinetobacter sp. ANC 3882]MCH7315766.1 glycosyltransferase [Acinetobacter sp. ANC 3882]